MSLPRLWYENLLIFKSIRKNWNLRGPMTIYKDKLDAYCVGNFVSFPESLRKADNDNATQTTT